MTLIKRIDTDFLFYLLKSVTSIQICGLISQTYY